MEQVGVALSLLAAGAFVTKATDLVRNVFGRFVPEDAKWVWNVVPALISLAIAFGVNVERPDIPEGFLTFELGEVGLAIVTAGAIWGIASGFHEKFDQWSSSAKARRSGTGS
jgi:hypothetical protein